MPLLASLRHCRAAMLSVFVTYVVAALIGGLMAHAGSALALGQRDRMVDRALTTSAAISQLRAGNRVRAATIDFAENVFKGAVPQTLLGLAIVPAYVSVAYQGWLGGIVSVDHEHRSRLTARASGSYFVLTLVLQFIAYSAAVGAGVQAGIDLYRTNAGAGWRVRMYRLPKRIVLTALHVYLVALPVFMLAAGVEFLWPFSR